MSDSESLWADVFEEAARKMAWRVAAEREQLVRAAAQAWLPFGLKWLVDRPSLLRLYLKLPHKRLPTTLIHPDGHCEVVLKPRGWGAGSSRLSR